jgi:hypothetical protein
MIPIKDLFELSQENEHKRRQSFLLRLKDEDHY